MVVGNFDDNKMVHSFFKSYSLDLVIDISLAKGQIEEAENGQHEIFIQPTEWLTFANKLWVMIFLFKIQLCTFIAQISFIATITGTFAWTLSSATSLKKNI